MKQTLFRGGIVLALAGLAGCAGSTAAKKEAPFKGEPLQIRYILGAHPNKQACVDYEAATNSCTSIITSEVDGNTMISREITALQVAGFKGVKQVEITTLSRLDGMKACARSQDIEITGRDGAAAAYLAMTRKRMEAVGGSVCNTYFRSGHGYVMSSVGANGQPYPPGDTAYQYIFEGDLKLRLR